MKIIEIGQADHIRRLVVMEERGVLIKDNTDEIIAFMKGAKTWSGYGRKWGPRIATFFIGIAIARGWITAENGHSFLSIFGL